MADIKPIPEEELHKPSHPIHGGFYGPSFEQRWRPTEQALDKGDFDPVGANNLNRRKG